MNLLRFCCSIPVLHHLIARQYKPTENEPEMQPASIASDSTITSLLSLPFKNRIGLAAGFDKNAKYLRELQALGFGFIEVGTVTPLAQDGNPKPRLFRLPKDKALINRMGFNNDGAEKVAARLKAWRNTTQNTLSSTNLKPATLHPQPATLHPQPGTLLIGGNIGKNKITPNEDAWKDYEICFLALHDYVDYFVVNVSSPNTPGLRELQEKESLRKILTHLQERNHGLSRPKPILLKIAPDLTWPQIEDVISLALEINLDGLVAANTTLRRQGLVTSHPAPDSISGGLSGAPLLERTIEIVQYIAAKTQGRIPIIASGGIFTAADAQLSLHAGASLVQVWTGFIYEGPGIVKKISKGLKLLRV